MVLKIAQLTRGQLHIEGILLHGLAAKMRGVNPGVSSSIPDSENLWD